MSGEASANGRASLLTAITGRKVHVHSSGTFADQDLPFCEAVEIDGVVLLSGQMGVIPGSLRLAAGGVAAETRQMMENIGATLEAAGLGFANIVKATVFLADMTEWPAFNAIYLRYFVKPYPARSALGTSGLALGARVEMECIAVR
ncbi:Rid family hydrolase [Acuticoccus mangrovi]|uniref:Enamine deaminase RidA n=1 Tax=Acuticoccus mangrovi TaxID=2796142 RepID=A0A934IS67_9HYPH|nr:Rid family hydrolase [Acuticoccus mangrovi]MBJ3776694.1 hypothetical protein [Acuticoccus mangrovi]